MKIYFLLLDKICSFLALLPSNPVRIQNNFNWKFLWLTSTKTQLYLPNWRSHTLLVTTIMPVVAPFPLCGCSRFLSSLSSCILIYLIPHATNCHRLYLRAVASYNNLWFWSGLVSWLGLFTKEPAGLGLWVGHSVIKLSSVLSVDQSAKWRIS